MALKARRSLPVEPAAGITEGRESERCLPRPEREQSHRTVVSECVCGGMLGLRGAWPHGVLGSAGEAALDSGLIYHGAKNQPQPNKTSGVEK